MNLQHLRVFGFEPFDHVVGHTLGIPGYQVNPIFKVFSESGKRDLGIDVTCVDHFDLHFGSVGPGRKVDVQGPSATTGDRWVIGRGPVWAHSMCDVQKEPISVRHHLAWHIDCARVLDTLAEVDDAAAGLVSPS